MYRAETLRTRFEEHVDGNAALPQHSAVSLRLTGQRRGLLRSRRVRRQHKAWGVSPRYECEKINEARGASDSLYRTASSSERDQASTSSEIGASNGIGTDEFLSRLQPLAVLYQQLSPAMRAEIQI